MRAQRTLFDLTQDGLVLGEKIQRVYPEFDVSGFVADVRTEMEGRKSTLNFCHFPNEPQRKNAKKRHIPT